MRLRINTNSIPGFNEGDEVEAHTKDGVIKDKYWRNRLEDSKIDNCVSIVDNDNTTNVEAT